METFILLWNAALQLISDFFGLNWIAEQQQQFINLNIYLKPNDKFFMFQIKNRGTQNYANGNTWIVRLQVNFTRYVCESTNIYSFFTKFVWS